MRIVFSGIAVLALATVSATGAGAASPPTMMNHGAMMSHGPMMMSHAMKMPKCTRASGPVVWYVSTMKTYFAKGAMMYGKGAGKYVCRATAAKIKGSHMGTMGAMMSHPHRMSGATTNGSTSAAPGAMAPATPGAMAPGAMTTPGAMAPGPMQPGAGASPPPGAMSPNPATSPQMNKAGPVSPGVPATPAASPAASPHG